MTSVLVSTTFVRPRSCPFESSDIVSMGCAVILTILLAFSAANFASTAWSICSFVVNAAGAEGMDANSSSDVLVRWLRRRIRKDIDMLITMRRMVPPMPTVRPVIRPVCLLTIDGSGVAVMGARACSDWWLWESCSALRTVALLEFSRCYTVIEARYCLNCYSDFISRSTINMLPRIVHILEDKPLSTTALILSLLHLFTARFWLWCENQDSNNWSGIAASSVHQAVPF